MVLLIGARPVCTCEISRATKGLIASTMRRSSASKKGPLVNASARTVGSAWSNVSNLKKRMML